jgi:hypothetical protein
MLAVDLGFLISLAQITLGVPFRRALCALN